MQNTPPRILLVSGLFFPDVGGPATHVKKMAEHFSSLGWKVTVVAFGDCADTEARYRVIRISYALPRLLFRTLYAKIIFIQSFRHDVVYAFDLTSSGLPAALSARLLCKPFLLRAGGDQVWERTAEFGGRLMPIGTYYESGFHTKDRPLLFHVARFVAHSAQAFVVPNVMLKELYVRRYGVDEKRIAVIKNPFGAVRENAKKEQGAFTFLFAGRFVLYKNLSRVIRAFSRVYARHDAARLTFVGDGPEKEALECEAKTLGVPLVILPKVEQAKLFDLTRSSSVSMAPALSEFNPNFIMETLALGKPALISRGNGLSVELPEYMQFDPEDEKDIEDAMERMLDSETYEKALSFVSSLDMNWQWRDALRAHERLVRNALKI